MRPPVLACLGLLLAMTLSACTVGDGATDGEVVAEVSHGDEVVGEITVSGPVGQVVNLHVFEIGTDGGESVLVVAPAGVGPLASGVEAEVTGTVETFDFAAIQARIGAPLDRELHRLNGRPCLVARILRSLPGPR